MSERISTTNERCDLIDYFLDNGFSDGQRWLFRAARRFADYEGADMFEAAKALIEHPRMQDTEYNRRNGYTPYQGPAELLSRIYRVSS